ncbi:fibronectin type III domain-containing protein [Patescibacteria group bacterium]|nr:fibronectin type III domain-containing protein [Patescibacteria group bacterium]
MKLLNKFKFLLTTLLFFSFILFFPALALAADLNIDCPAAPTACSKTGVDPFFSDSLDGYWYPGKSITKTLSLKNSAPETQEMAIKGERTSPESILEEVMHISIVGGTTVIWSGSVADFYALEKIGMGTFAPGVDFDYDFTVSMSSGADDNYQNKETVFDLTLGFWGESISSPTPTPTAGGGGGAVLGAGVSAPVCTDTKPGVPANFAASVGLGAGQVSLSWTLPALPYTYFLIAYSDDSTTMKWGNPNVGTATSYVVSGLGSGTYWFWLRAGNGCMPGDFVGPVSPGAITGAAGAPAVAPGFSPEVLGEATPSAEGETTVPGLVQGKSDWHWWPWLFSFIPLGWLLYYLYKRRRLR